MEGEELLLSTLAGGRGAFLFLPHLGNWEIDWGNYDPQGITIDQASTQRMR